ncbi:hypothetical protein HOY82DRAFT_642974 [Tuber indicum]|nr:hypothetical protein HOY82DRAFT_642974 [Tuber indicum]
MPHSEPPVPSIGSTLTSHSYSESTLLKSYVLEASETPEPTLTTNTTSNDHDREHLPTSTAGPTTTTAATSTTHLLSHMHLSPNPNPNPQNHQTIHYPPHPSPSTRTLPPTAATSLHALRQSLPPVLSHDLDLDLALLLQEQPLTVFTLVEFSVRSIPTEEFLPRPYFPPAAQEHELGSGRTAQSGYAIQRFLGADMGEESNVVYARSVGIDTRMFGT